MKLFSHSTKKYFVKLLWYNFRIGYVEVAKTREGAGYARLLLAMLCFQAEPQRIEVRPKESLGVVEDWK